MTIVIAQDDLHTLQGLVWYNEASKYDRNGRMAAIVFFSPILRYKAGSKHFPFRHRLCIVIIFVELKYAPWPLSFFLVSSALPISEIRKHS